jgi:hypothetical protein
MTADNNNNNNNDDDDDDDDATGLGSVARWQHAALDSRSGIDRSRALILTS